MREGYILGLGMGYIQGKNIEELLVEGDLSHRGLVRRSPIPPFDPFTKKIKKQLKIIGNALCAALLPGC